MDGTLIDTEPFWIAEEMALAARFGVEWTYDDALTLVGNPLDVSADILSARGIAMPRDEIIATLVESVAARARVSMPWMDDARTLLDACVAAGIPCALVTMSIGSLVDAFLAEAGDVFVAVVTGDQVKRGKPDPEPYLTACARLGVDPARCVAIEDSGAGVRSAYASGARTIAVRRHTAVPDLPGITIVDDLWGLTPALLAP